MNWVDRSKPIALAAGAMLAMNGCVTTETSSVVRTPKVATYDTGYSGPRSTMAVGKFANSSPFLRGIFADGQDRLGNQAKTILKTHLSQTNRFNVVDRSNLKQMASENKLAGKTGATESAQIIITGDVTEFGRKSVGDRQLFGLFGRGKQQIAYSKVSLNVVDVSTSRIIFSSQGAGEYSLSNREILGTGGTAGYDSTLNGKVLNLSIVEAVNKLVAGLEAGKWSVPATTQ